MASILVSGLFLFTLVRDILATSGNDSPNKEEVKSINAAFGKSEVLEALDVNSTYDNSDYNRQFGEAIDDFNINYLSTQDSASSFKEELRGLKRKYEEVFSGNEEANTEDNNEDMISTSDNNQELNTTQNNQNLSNEEWLRGNRLTTENEISIEDDLEDVTLVMCFTDP